MAQFQAYENPNKASRPAYPWLLDIQSDLLADLRTTVVIPLCPIDLSAKAEITRLTPVVELNGRRWLALTPQMAGIDRRLLGKSVADLNSYRVALVASLDFLISGI